jgi:3'-5' exoribonuclease
MKLQFVSNIKEGEIVDSQFAVSEKSLPIPYRNGKDGMWFSVNLVDNTGMIQTRYWGKDNTETKQIWESVQKGDVIQVKGKVIHYNNSLQISVSEPFTKVENYSIDDFLPKSKQNSHEMLSELKNLLSEINNPYISGLVNKFLDDSEFMEKFTICPAAIKGHQNYLGGLLEHTLNLIRTIPIIVQNHPKLNKDLLLAGCFLHDIGKVKEYEVAITPFQSDEGRLIGHISLGQQMVEEKIGQIPNFPQDLRCKIIHVVLSHHGKMEWGSPKEPQFPEALAVHLIDHIDAQIDYSLKNTMI